MQTVLPMKTAGYKPAGKLRGQPLLEEPGRDERPILIEITPEAIEGTGLRLGELAGGKSWGNFLHLAANMKKLGLKADEHVGKYGKETHDWLSADFNVKQMMLEAGAANEINDWPDVVSRLVDVNALGIGSAPRFGGHEQFMAADLRLYEDGKDMFGRRIEGRWGLFASHAANLKRLGIKADYSLRGCEPGIRDELVRLGRAGDWRSYARHAADMKAIGLDVYDDVRPRIPSLRKSLYDAAEKKEWDAYTQLAANLLELDWGTLNPGETDEKNNLPLPPLRRFRGRGR